MQLISVAMTVRNARDVVERQLDALAGQEYDQPWELVISDGGSTDGTLQVVEDWIKKSTLDAQLIQVDRPGISLGRNIAVAHASGDLILFCDADDQVGNSWLQSMSEAFNRGRLVVGKVILSDEHVAAPDDTNSAGWDQSAVGPERLGAYEFLPIGLTANLGVHRTLFNAIGGFDEGLIVGEDIDFVWRAQEAEREVPIYCDESFVVKSMRDRPALRFRQHFRFGLADPLLYLRHREYGMQRSLMSAVRTWLWIVASTPLTFRRQTRSRWAASLGHRLGRLAGSLRYRTLFP